MKTIITTIAATLFATSLSADDIYHGFEVGNSDLYRGYTRTTSEITAVQPGVGDGFDRYHGWADGNHDLFKDVSVPAVSSRSAPVNVYHGFEIGNTDLQ